MLDYAHLCALASSSVPSIYIYIYTWIFNFMQLSFIFHCGSIDRMCRAVDVVSIVVDPIFMWTVTFNTPLLHLMAQSNILFYKQSAIRGIPIASFDAFHCYLTARLSCRMYSVVPRVISTFHLLTKYSSFLVCVCVSSSGSGSVYITFIKFNKIVLLTNSNVYTQICWCYLLLIFSVYPEKYDNSMERTKNIKHNFANGNLFARIVWANRSHLHFACFSVGVDSPYKVLCSMCATTIINSNRFEPFELLVSYRFFYFNFSILVWIFEVYSRSF